MRILAHRDWGGSTRSVDQVKRLGGDLTAVVTLDRSEAALGLAESVKIGSRGAARALVGDVERVVLVGAGRIDNLAELRLALGLGHQESPADLLIRAYTAWGVDFPARLTGDFALVLWDVERRRMLAVRDAFGITPLSYRASRQGLWIASGIEQILRTFESPPDLDDQMIVEYLLWRFKASDATFFREIRQIPAGHLLVADSSEIRIERYWVPPLQEPRSHRLGKREAYYEEFQRLFVQSVERRLQPKGSVIVHVSGGLDSSSVAAAADSLARRGSVPISSLRGAAGRFPGLPCDEEVFIDAVERHIDFPIERWDATEADSSDLIDPTIECPGGRITNIGGSDGDVAIANRTGASAILTGIGGDQLGTCSGIVRTLVSRGEWAKAARDLFFFPDATAKSRWQRLRGFTGQVAPIPIQRWATWVRAAIPTWLAPDLHRLARDLAMADPPRFAFDAEVHSQTWNRICAAHTLHAIESLQRQAASTGLEYRFPFLDGDLVRFVLQFPYDFWPRPAPYARLHREALEDLLPPSIAARHGKAEFTPALRERIRQASDILEAIFSDSQWASAKYVDRAKALRFWRNVTKHPDQARSRDWRQIWAMATLEAWLRRVFLYHGAHGGGETR
jgi:asparagine synthase (glutamine-hydrolysing)